MKINELSPREQEVLELLYQGLTNQEIADKLIISIITAKAHVHSIYIKLGCKGKCDLMAKRIKELEEIFESKQNKCSDK